MGLHRHELAIVNSVVTPAYRPAKSNSPRRQPDPRDSGSLVTRIAYPSLAAWSGNDDLDNAGMGVILGAWSWDPFGYDQAGHP